MNKTGLVLEGGGMRGLYTAGVIDAMLDMAFQPDVICGTSAGAAFGVNLKSKQRERVIRYNTRFAGDKRYISIESYLKTGDMINVPFAYDLLPRELDPFDNDTYCTTPTEFFATVTNMRTGKAEYIRIDDGWKQMDAIRASASLPFLSRPVQIGSDTYLDGGIVDNIPLTKCQEEGCNKIIVVLTRPKGQLVHDHLEIIGRLWYSKYPKLQHAFRVRNRNYLNRIEEIDRLEQDGQIVVIRPSRLIGVARLEHDPAKLNALYQLGLHDTQTLRPQIEAYLSH